MTTVHQDERTVQVDYLRFDLLLAAIPIALFSGLVSSLLLPISHAAGLVIGGVTAAGIVAYSMYEVVRLDSQQQDDLDRTDRRRAPQSDRGPTAKKRANTRDAAW